MNVRFGAQITAAAAAHHLDPRLLAAVAAQETGGPGSNSGRNVVGDAGHGRGLFQIDDRSWSFARTAAAMDPAKNAEMAATILADDLHASGGDVRAALSTYNAGSPTATGTTTMWGDGSTLGYADSVLRHYRDLGGDPGALADPQPQGAEPARQTIVLDRALEDERARQALVAYDPTATYASPLGASLWGTPGLASLATRPGALGQGFSSSPPAPIAWERLSGLTTREAHVADTTMVDLIDSQDVFADGSDDDT